MKQIKRIFLTSWDDGRIEDLELADLLLEYRIPAVFYIPIECDLLSYQIRRLAGLDKSCPLCKFRRELFDIGAHTVTHPEDLKKLSDKEAFEEIYESKVRLEKILGRPVKRFAYPGGRYDERIKELVRKAGFTEARTTQSGSIEFPKDLLAIKPTAHVHPEKMYENDLTWKEFAEKKLEEVIEKGGRFELWGHSYELYKYNMWEFLQDFLAYMDDELKRINYPRKINIY